KLFQLDKNNLSGRGSQILNRVLFRCRPHRLPTLTAAHARRAIGERKLRASISKVDRHSVRMLVLRGLVVSLEIDLEHSHSVILKHNLVTGGVYLHRIKSHSRSHARLALQFYE